MELAPQITSHEPGSPATEPMKKNPETIVKFYNYKMLLRLVVRDMERASGVKMKPKDGLYFISGLDTEGNIYLRVDISPMKVKRRR